MRPDFWSGKRVFITGHTGFKGSWLCLLLNNFGAKVTGYSLPPPTNPSLYADANISRDVETIFGDIRDEVRLSSALKNARPEIVLHLAAQPLVRYSYQAPSETFSINVLGLVNLLEAVRRADSVRAVVNVTSDKCYENREWSWAYRETEAMGGFDPYSSSKGCAELVTAAYRRSYFNPDTYAKHGVALASARAGNVIGGGDWSADRLVPDILRALLAGEEIIVRNPEAIRPWQHVLEPLSGYLMLAEKLASNGPEFADAWNFGPSEDDARPVKWIVDYLVKAWGEGASFRLSVEAGPHEAHFLKIDSSKARQQLGWRPKWTLPSALDAVVEWGRGYSDKVSIRNGTIKQIEAYMMEFGHE